MSIAGFKIGVGGAVNRYNYPNLDNPPTIPTKTSDLTNDSGFQTAEEVETAIGTHLATVYKAAGSVASIAALPAPSAAYLGFVYDIETAFTTTADFVEGAGISYPAGTDVAIVVVESGGATTYKYDVLSGSAPVTSVNGLTGAVTLTIPSSAADVGAIAAPSSPATGAFLVWSGSAWVAQTLSTWQGGSF